MTSSVNASSGIAAAASGQNFSVTVANSGTVFGFVLASFGAVSPTSFKGIAIDSVSTDATGGVPFDFGVSLDGGGVLAQNFFRGVLVQRTNGTWVRYETAAATSFSAGSSTWLWGTGSSPVWTGTGTRPIILYR